MTDPRIQLADLTTSGDEVQVLRSLDRLRLVLRLAPDRGQSQEDAIGLANLVNVAARVFPHWEFAFDQSLQAGVPLFGEGALVDLLRAVVDRVSVAATCQPEEDVEICWGGTPTLPGLAIDARGWSCSIGPEHLPLQDQQGPPLGALAAGNWAAGQLLVLALKPLDMPGHLTSGFRWNLLTYTADEAPTLTGAHPWSVPPFTNAGCGSVGSSIIYAAVVAALCGGKIDLVDPDVFKSRNRLRYPILLDDLEGTSKAEWLEGICKQSGIDAEAYPADLLHYVNAFELPPAIDLVAVSVDEIEGRRDATDLLAKRTVNLGVAGLALHISSHGFGDEGCAYCQYVDVAPSRSGAAVLAEIIGLPVDRILGLLEGDGLLTKEDAAALSATGKYGDSPPKAGDRLADVRRRAYAEAQIQMGDGELRVSAPHVSAMAGVLGLAELIKHAPPGLQDRFKLAGRVDLDLSGEPAGFVATTARDPSRRCLCYSGFRRRAWRTLHEVE
jgi:hypothetical protein